MAMFGGAGGEKQRIRMETKQVAMNLDPAYRAEASRSITKQVLDLPEWRNAETVMAYVSMAEEPDTKEIIRAALDEGKTLLLPRCVDRSTMVALPVSNPDTLEKGILGIPEPPAAEAARPLPAQPHSSAASSMIRIAALFFMSLPPFCPRVFPPDPVSARVRHRKPKDLTARMPTLSIRHEKAVRSSFMRWRQAERRNSPGRRTPDAPRVPRRRPRSVRKIRSPAGLRSRRSGYQSSACCSCS